MLTRTFKSGNSLAVRIPKELGFTQAPQDVEIERKGDDLVIRVVQKRTLAGIGQIFASFPKGFMADGREVHEQKPRAWKKKAAR